MVAWDGVEGRQQQTPEEEVRPIWRHLILKSKEYKHGKKIIILTGVRGRV